MEEIKCKECGASIFFVTTLRGKLMPCDAATVYFVADMKNGTENFITTSGVTMRGRRVDPGTENSVAAYVPHWATCPAAEKFKTPAAEKPQEKPPETPPAEKPPAAGKKSGSLFKRLQELSKQRTPIIFPDPRSHEDIEFSYIRDVISRWNDERQGFEIFVVLYDKKANYILECSPKDIKIKELENDT